MSESSADVVHIDWEWPVNVYPHRAHDEAVNKLLQLQAEALLLEACAIPAGWSHPHNDAYAVQRACEKLKLANDALRAEVEERNRRCGYQEGYRARMMHDRVKKAVVEAFEREWARHNL